MPSSWDWGGLKLGFSSVTSSLYCHHLHGCRYKMLTKACYIKKKGGGGEEKRFRQKKNETAYPMENFKGQVPFLCSFVYFSCDFFFFFFSFLESERAREKSHRKHSDHEKHQELGKLSGRTRKARILNKRKAFVICQKFLCSFCLPTERPALFGGPSLPVEHFTLNWGARKVLSTRHCCCCYPGECRAPGLPAAEVPGLGAGDLRPRRPPSFCWESCAHHSFGEGRAPANGAGGVQAPSLGTGTKRKLCFNRPFHLSRTVSLHFCKGRAVSCRTFCHCRVVALLKQCRQSPRMDFPPFITWEDVNGLILRVHLHNA